MRKAKLISRIEKCSRCSRWETFYRELSGVSKIWICTGCGHGQETFDNSPYLPWSQSNERS